MISEEKIKNAGILVIDDSETNIAVIERLLQIAGYTSFLSITDPREAQDMYVSFAPDLVLLDINMPYLDGFQVMEKFKEVSTEEYLPVLVLTAQKDRETCQRALTEGAMDFLTKPFDQVEMLRRIENMLMVRLLNREVKEKKLILEKEHQEAEAIGSKLLKRKSGNNRWTTSVGVEPCTKASGDRAGFVMVGNKEKCEEWLLVLDATGHGKGAAKFQEVALGGLLALLQSGKELKEALITTNTMLDKLETGKFLVGNIWRLMNEEERQAEEGHVWIEEFNIAQHTVLSLDPNAADIFEWQWTPEEKKTFPMGIFKDSLDGLIPKYRHIRKGTRILTYTDGITEAQNATGEMFGMKWLKTAVLETRSLSPEEARLSIVDKVKKWSGEFVSDDITLAIIDINK